MKAIARLCLNERNMMIAIGLNAIVIFILSFPNQLDNKGLLILDNLFIIFFAIEAFVKIKQFGWKSYIKDGWNRFDFILVILSLPDLVIWLNQYGVVMPFSEFMGDIIILRLFRLLRIFKLISFIPNMSKMLSGLTRALKASTFVLVVLLVFNVILAIFTCHLYRDTVPEYFRDPLISSYSIFQLFTVEGWYEIPNLIAEKTDNSYLVGFSKLYFIAIVLFGGVFGMSLANAIFVDEMTSDNNIEIEEKLVKLQSDMDEIKELLTQKGK